MTTLRHVRTPTLDIAYEESGVADGAPVILLHGWPYDPRCHCFAGPFERRTLPAVGHNPPQEAPVAFADAVLSLL